MRAHTHQPFLTLCLALALLSSQSEIAVAGEPISFTFGPCIGGGECLRLRANVDVRITAITTNNGECGNDRVYLGVPQGDGTFEQLLAGEPSSRYGAAQLLPILPLALKQGMLSVLTLHCPLREIGLNTDQGMATFSAE